MRIYDGSALATGHTVQIVPGFLAYAWPMWNGVNVAVGDVNGDGYDDLIVSQDAGGTTKVRVWSCATITSSPTTLVNALPPYQQFFANGLDSRDGIHLVVRDIDGDGKAEVITSPWGGTTAGLACCRSAIRPSILSRPYSRSDVLECFMAFMWDNRPNKLFENRFRQTARWSIQRVVVFSRPAF